MRGFGASCALELCADGPWPRDPEIDPWLPGVEVTEQGPGDLGRRMLSCFERARDEGAGATLILAADAPTLPAAHVHDALRALGGNRSAVVSPVPDGGYVLIGLERPRPELFREIPWGGPRVLELTLARAREHEIDLLSIAPWYDVDTPADLRRLRDDLAAPGAADRAPKTAQLLAGLPGAVV